ncbi:DUF5107 domain-containing protein [Acidipila sp. EB88]|uniref:DUF5107 domain-containing protein n=1 Tax=Acidipila sp. EB88 TaxID=2305226 RepID=UPI000F601F81|nr:DUF5107 domain-containing protein [Acidipila sp. EB88]RRA48476.1 DUF5107 domain-containing protein [Acidipila sp. EB88]
MTDAADRAASRLVLPEAPSAEGGPVKAWHEAVSMLSYLPAAPDRNPLFLDKRVYQGSSGRLYPLPCIDRIASEPVMKSWNAVHLENAFLRIMILPEIGGRLHVGLDKRNGYDFFYRQDVIKPALVGLAGPWISGGVEFNWPQHHRPATFMPVEIEIEREAGGVVTVWCGDHDPMQRMKGMHGVRLHPDRAMLELRVRLYNRTETTQTFLWWANVAARVHEQYQSFFPPDVRFVADHAKRAVTSFPLSDRSYYGVDYPGRAAEGVPTREQPASFVPDGSYAANDLSWYANIPVPTSYMITGTAFDFFGGYDHAAHAGFVHVADHHVAPGKKQWTWGNHEFGYAWDRSLTDHGGPYIELMAGVYTDNQPDFSYLAPGETKVFSQFWYPLAGLGIPQAASLDAALHVETRNGCLLLRIAVTRRVEGATLHVEAGGHEMFVSGPLTLDPSELQNLSIPEVRNTSGLTVTLRGPGGPLLRYHVEQPKEQQEPEPATEPPLPAEMDSVEQLYLTGLHLELYRHATRSPEAYWLEALRRDPQESRTNTAMGRWRLKHGQLEAAVHHFRRAIARLTERHPNPADGEPFYYLGLALRALGEPENAYNAFYKATWVAAWCGPAYHALGERDCARGDWERARDHLQRSLGANADNNNALSLLVVALRRLQRSAEAAMLLSEALERDPLDVWFRYLQAETIPESSQAAIDLALDMQRAGLLGEAKQLFEAVAGRVADSSSPMALYLLAWMHEQDGKADLAAQAGRRAATLPPDYVFPSRLDEMIALKAACLRNAQDARAPYYLGNYLYDRKRPTEAIEAWERATRLDPSFPTAWRNLGIACFNTLHDEPGALEAYERALQADPADARILYERDQLWKRTGVPARDRLAELDRFPELTASRDDLSVERATLLNQMGRVSEALQLLLSRPFQPWEGGEGLVLAQFVRSHLVLGRQSLAEGKPEAAAALFHAALRPPQNLSEAWHLLANQSQVFYWIGIASRASGQEAKAREALLLAAGQRGDFQQMSVQAVSEMTYWSALALRELGEEQAAAELFMQILHYAEEQEAAPAVIDYFATSLPTMLLFEEDLGETKKTRALLLRGQALLGLGRHAEARAQLQEFLQRNPNDMDATELDAEAARHGASC